MKLLLFIIMVGCTKPTFDRIKIAFETTEEPNSDPCTDPYYTTVINGVTYSGSTKTAHDAYLSDEKLLKRILYEMDLTKEERRKRTKNVLELMDHYNKFRCLCPENCKSKPVAINK